MYESFFGMEHTPFVRDVPPEKLFESNASGKLSVVWLMWRTARCLLL